MRHLPGECTHPGQTPAWKVYASRADACLESVRIQGTPAWRVYTDRANACLEVHRQGKRLPGECTHPGQTPAWRVCASRAHIELIQKLFVKAMRRRIVNYYRLQSRRTPLYVYYVYLLPVMA